MGKINSRSKGKRGELEWAKEVQSKTGFASRRGQQYSGSPDSPDVISDGLPIHWEVKRVESGNPYKWLAQAKADAGPERLPVVAHRRNDQEWVIVLAADDFLDLINTVYQTDE